MSLVQAVVILALTSAPEDAREVRPVAAVLSVGGGYAVPFGNLFNTDEININNAMKGGFPIRGEVGIALWDRWHLVVYGHYAFLDRSQRCTPTQDCTGSSLHIGGQVQYWGERHYGLTPFIGLGGGWEKLSLDAVDVSLAFSGFEGKLTGGVLYFFGNVVGIGPFVELSMGAYSHLDVVAGTGRGSETIRNQALHAWLTFGLRVDLWP